MLLLVVRGLKIKVSIQISIKFPFLRNLPSMCDEYGSSSEENEGESDDLLMSVSATSMNENV